MLASIGRLLFGVALGLALTAPATAAEQLVMPFACRAEGGNVSLAPSAPQAYRIYGRKESKRMTTCSPFDPRRCHNWSVYRFDVDCGGVRTSWQSIVAAMTPILAESSRSLGADAGVDPRSYDGPAGTYAPGAGPTVRFPRGFAPNPMRVARFEHAKDEPAQVALPPKKPALTAPAQVAESEPSPKPTATPPLSANNAAGADKTSPEPPKATDVAKSAPLKIEIVSGSETTGSIEEPGAGSTLWRDAAMAFALTLAALLILSVTVLLWRRNPPAMPLAIAPLPDDPTTHPAHARSSGAATHQPREVAATGLRLWDEDWLPATMREALDVLGVDPGASRDAMKTTVTRLRRALHPDHAFDEEDRRLRERRLKQINVAWDIVSGKRRSLWLSAKPRST